MLAAEFSEIGDSNSFAIGIDKTSVRLAVLARAAMHMRPFMMTTDPSIRHREHVRVVESMLATEFGKIGNRLGNVSFGIDKAFVCFDVIALPNIIAMSPAFMCFMFARTTGNPTHSFTCKAVLATELCKICDNDLVAFWIDKSIPNACEFTSW